MKTEDQILLLLSRQSAFNSIKIVKENLNVDIVYKSNILTMYKLRLEISIAKKNQQGIDLCQELIKIVSSMKGVSIYLISYKFGNNQIICYLDKSLSNLYIVPKTT